MRKKNSAAGNSIVCFAASIPCQSRHLTVRRIRTVSKSATFLAMESVNSAHFKRWETEVQNFWQGKRKTLRQYWGAHFWQGEVQNSSPILARQWWRHFRLSLSVSLSLSHRMYLTHNIGSSSALPIIPMFFLLFQKWTHFLPNSWKVLKQTLYQTLGQPATCTGKCKWENHSLSCTCWPSWGGGLDKTPPERLLSLMLYALRSVIVLGPKTNIRQLNTT